MSHRSSRLEKKSAILEGHCKEVGSDFEAIVRSANFNILCAETEAGVRERKEWFRDHMARYVSPAAVDRWTRMYESSSGTPEQIVEKLNSENTVDVPPSLVDQQSRIMEQEVLQSARRIGYPAQCDGSSIVEPVAATRAHE